MDVKLAGNNRQKQFAELEEWREKAYHSAHVLLQHFWLGLTKESALFLDISAGGSFTHKTTEEGEALLDRIAENLSLLEPLRVEFEPRDSPVHPLSGYGVELYTGGIWQTRSKPEPEASKS